MRAAYASLPEGALLEIRSSVTEHDFAVRAWAAKAGWRVVDHDSDGKLRRILIERQSSG